MRHYFTENELNLQYVMEHINDRLRSAFSKRDQPSEHPVDDSADSMPSVLSIFDLVSSSKAMIYAYTSGQGSLTCAAGFRDLPVGESSERSPSEVVLIT